MLVLPRTVIAEGLARRLLGGTSLGLCLSSLALGAAAQTAGTAPSVLPPISVETGRTADTNYKPEASSLPKLTEPLKDTPQSITVVPRQMLDDQAATNFRDALRAVPGISLQAGEGGAQGDNLSIRGFNARNDIFLDGMRDFGSYYRDPFNYESIEVLKGPSSVLFGRGSTGGVVNQVSKTPELNGFVAGSGTLGTDLTRRATVDVNQPIPGLAGAAIRLNAMIHDNEVAGRDVAENRRWGVAPSLALGLGTPTRFTLSYFHLSEDDQPDYGIPFLLARPAPVNHNNYYGFDGENFIDTTADVVTARLEHDFNQALSLRTQFRYANYFRNVQITEARIPASVTAATPLSSIMVDRGQLVARSTETFLENQTDATTRFSTFGLGHTLVTGFEVARETSDPRRRTFAGVPGTSLLFPNPDDAFAGTATVSSDVKTTSKSVGVYALDTLKVTNWLDLIGGARWDRFDTDFEQRVGAAAGAFNRVDEEPSWRGAVVFKPVPIGSFYASYGTSFNPSAESLSLTAATVNTPPEKNEVYEVGTKWDVLDEALSLRAAVYRIIKTNARTPDPNGGLENVVTGEQRVNGFELEASGRITKDWQIFSGYAFADGKVTKSNNLGEVGNPTSNTPKHTFSLWTTYNLPYRFQVGGGAYYVASRLASSTRDAATGLLREVPDYWRFDAMVKYAVTDNVDLQLNLYNLTDEFYFETIHPGHIIPGPGRTALLTTSFHF